MQDAQAVSELVLGWYRKLWGFWFGLIFSIVKEGDEGDCCYENTTIYITSVFKILGNLDENCVNFLEKRRRIKRGMDNFEEHLRNTSEFTA